LGLSSSSVAPSLPPLSRPPSGVLIFWVDYGFAFLFGIFFQYFSIAPMSGDYGSKSLSRITKANFLSLAFFEIGPFGWMDIFQLAIF